MSEQLQLLRDGPLAADEAAHRISDNGRSPRCPERTPEAVAIGKDETLPPPSTGTVQSAGESVEGGSCGAGPNSRAARIVHLAQQAPLLTDAELGELDCLLDRQINTASSKQMRAFLYDPPPAGCGFQKRWIKDGAKNTNKLSTSIDALLANYRLKQDRRLELCLLLSDRLTQCESLNCKLDKDGRIRFSLNLAGTKVGRAACHASNTGSGYGLHSTQDRHKHLFRADPGFDFYSVDLAGADSWTVAAECKALGDPTMWLDLTAGLKPAKVLSLLYLEGSSVNSRPRDQLASQCRALPKDWLYDSAKKACHGSAYGEAEVTMAETILRDSWQGGGKLVNVTAAQCRKLQSLFFQRYPGVKRRIERIKMLLQRDGFLIAASGLKRDFFAPKNDHQTLKDALPFTPAANTAHCCNLALLKLWQDRAEGVQPLLTVHDAILFQAPQAKRQGVAERIPAWFANPICVAGTTFTIPFEALRGPSWGQLEPL